MPQIIVIKPGELPRAQSTGKSNVVQLADLHKAIGTLHLSASGLGTIPPQGTRVHMWYDDLGLMNEATPNRRLPNGTIVCGTIVLCAVVACDDVGFNHEEVAFLMNNINAKWERLQPETRKPKPEWKVTVLSGVRS